MTSSACLVTSPPTFDPPKRTAPFLISSSAEPDPRSVIIFDESARQSVAFSADVVSEDDGQPVLFRLYVDYGFALADGEDPLSELLFRGQPITTIKPLKAGTMTDTEPRHMHADWNPQLSGTISFGCHTVTLIASHDFDLSTGCPQCLNDSSQITWQVFHCNEAKGIGCAFDFTECRNQWTRTCPLVPSEDDTAKCGDSP